MNETHIPYYDFRDWDVTQNDQVFQQAIATARHLEVRWCQGHSSLDAPSELNPPQRIPSLLLYCTTSATGRGLTVVLTCYSGRLLDVHVGRVDT